MCITVCRSAWGLPLGCFSLHVRWAVVSRAVYFWLPFDSGALSISPFQGFPGAESLDGFRASCIPSSVLVVTFCVPLVKGEDEFVSGFRAGLNSVLQRENADDELHSRAVCPLLPLLSRAMVNA